MEEETERDKITIQDHPAYLSTVLHILYMSQGNPGAGDWGRLCAMHFTDVPFYPHNELIRTSPTIAFL